MKKKCFSFSGAKNNTESLVNGTETYSVNVLSLQPKLAPKAQKNLKPETKKVSKIRISSVIPHATVASPVTTTTTPAVTETFPIPTVRFSPITIRVSCRQQF